MGAARIADEVVEGFRALGDLTGTVSDVLDQLGIVGVCFVPMDKAEDVLAIARRWSTWEEERLNKLAAGISLEEFTRLKRPE
jgi:hypothetical protein